MTTTPLTLAFLGNFGWQEIIVLALLGVLIFGRRLPEVGRSIGKGIVEFKKGLAGIEDDVDKSTDKPSIDRPVSEKGKIEQADSRGEVSTESSEKTSNSNDA